MFKNKCLRMNVLNKFCLEQMLNYFREVRKVSYI